MGVSAFADWLDRLQSHLGWSDTKLASEIGVSASTISLWKNRGITPRSEKHIDRLVEISGEDRATVYALAGRGYIGMSNAFSEEAASFAFDVEQRLNAIKDPKVREFARESLPVHLGEWWNEIERFTDFLNSLGPKRPAE